MHPSARDRTQGQDQDQGRIAPAGGAPETAAVAPDRHFPDALRGMLPHIPDEPGVYLMRDAAGGVIYVGKARSLRKRLSSYFSASGKRPGL